MIIITRVDITDEELDHIRERVEAAGLHTHLSRGERRMNRCRNLRIGR